MAQFILYGTSACHLCEIAQDMVQQQHAAGIAVNLTRVDISDSDDLFQRYGVLIPVLQHPDGRELNWPFSPSRLQQFLLS